MTGIIRAGIRGDGYARLRHALTNHLPFTTSGSLTGSTRDTQRHTPCGFGERGYLRGADLDAFNRDYDRIAYIVRSYLTPIAWVLEDGTVYRVSQKFSVTTSKHQGTLYLLGNGPGAYGIERVWEDHPDNLTCGSCGAMWRDDITPAGRCPWEGDHTA